jgi:hypothetical protein
MQFTENCWEKVYNIRKSYLVLSIVLTGFILSVVYHTVMAKVFGYDYYPYNTFLFWPEDRFNDFFNHFYRAKHLNPYYPPNVFTVYFPFTYFCVYLLTFLPAKVAFALLFGIFICSFAYYVFRNLPASDYLGRISGVFILTFLSYPILFTVDRGNLEILVFLFLLLFVNYYQKGDDVKSVIFLSLAIAMKLYPGVFVVLFYADKKYKNIIYTGILVLALSVLSAAVMEGGIQASLQGLQNNLGLFKEAYMRSVMGLHFNTSLYGAITILGNKFTFLSIVIKYYTVIALIAFALISLFIVLKEKEFWKRVSLLVFMMLLLPQVTFDYKMIHLYIALMLFLNSHKQSQHDMLYAILFGLILIPKDYLIIQPDISIAVFLNPLLMLMIAGIILLDRTSRRV